MDSKRLQILEWIEKHGGIKGGVGEAAPPAGTPGDKPPAGTGGSAAATQPSNEDIAAKWKELLPQDIKDTDFIKNTKSFTELAIQAVNAQKLIGGRIPIPKDDADEKAWGEIYSKLGRPEKIDGYKIDRPANAAEIGYNENLEKSFLELGHKLGLNNKQANALVKWQTEAATADIAQSAKAMSDGLAQLKKDWGTNFDTRVAQVKRVVDEYESSYPGLVQMLEKNNLGSHPAFVKFFFDMTEGLMEDNEGGKGTGEGGGIATAAQAQAEINKLMADKAFSAAYHNQRNPGHNAAVDRIIELRQMMVETT